MKKREVSQIGKDKQKELSAFSKKSQDKFTHTALCSAGPLLLAKFPAPVLAHLIERGSSRCVGVSLDPCPAPHSQPCHLGIMEVAVPQLACYT